MISVLFLCHKRKFSFFTSKPILKIEMIRKSSVQIKSHTQKMTSIHGDTDPGRSFRSPDPTWSFKKEAGKILGSRRKTPKITGIGRSIPVEIRWDFFLADSYKFPMLSDRNRSELIGKISKISNRNTASEKNRGITRKRPFPGRTIPHGNVWIHRVDKSNPYIVCDRSIMNISCLLLFSWRRPM